MVETDTKVLFGILALIVGIWGWFLKHVSCGNRHPDKSDLMYKDVCDERTHRLEGLIESHAERSAERHTELKDDVRTGFSEMKELIKAK
ncbi:hypothetical protein KAR91_50850 [Candidatus Pacearchaeota archaeon]|nr:hypothetical protein [Candidatus Pacearchaeota archaeon]